MFNAYMTDDVVLLRKTGTAAWGEKETDRVTVRARVEDKNILIRNTTGEMVMVQAIVYLHEIDLDPGDKIEIDGVSHPILTIKKNKAFSRTQIMEVGIG